MLNFFRRRDFAVRFILGGFLVVICVAMVIMLIPGGLGGNGGPNSNQTVASVDGVSISATDLNNEITRIAQGRPIPQSILPYVGPQILKNLLMQTAMSSEARNLGFSATNEEVVHAARAQDPQLFPDGQFIGQQAYAAYVDQNYQMTVPEYEHRLRDQILQGKLYNLITDGVQVSEAEVHQAFLTQNQTAVFDYVLVNPSDLESRVQVTPAALDAYYKAHSSSYLSPERRQLNVLLANIDQMTPQQHVTEAQINQYYVANHSLYSFPEQVKVSHILFKTTGEDLKQEAATKKLAEKVLKMVQNGGNFADLAKKYSQDPGSAPQGGELGWIKPGQTVPEFQKAAFSLKPGQISGLIHTIYGYHIIKVEGHQDAHVEPLSQVHDQIQQKLQHQKALNAAQSDMDRAQTMAAAGTPLASIATQLHLQYIQTQPISRTDPVTGIGINPTFVNAVFAANPDGVTPVVQVAQGFAFAKVEKIIQPAVQPLAAVQDQVTTEFKREQARTMAIAEARQLADAARTAGLKAAAAKLKLTLKTSKPLTRSGSLTDAGSIQSIADALFSMNPGAVGGPAKLNSDEIVYSLTSIQQPTDAEFAQQADSIRQTLLQNKRTAVFTAYEDALEQRLTKSGKLKIHETALRAALGGGPGPAGPGNGGGVPSPLGL